MNESMITGESRPVAKDVGDAVIAGTVNGEGSLRVDITRTGDRTALAGIMRLVEQAQTSRSRTQVLADRATEIRVGQPDEQVSVMASEVGASVVVIGPHGDRPRPSKFLGTTAGSHCPELPGSCSRRDESRGALSPSHPRSRGRRWRCVGGAGVDPGLR